MKEGGNQEWIPLDERCHSLNISGRDMFFHMAQLGEKNKHVVGDVGQSCPCLILKV
jgi:hypothetical protein